jgi:uncharacterized damage-inducible protein DinB
MGITEILDLFAYDRWANHRILHVAGHLETARYLAPAHLSHGSLRGTLVHILATQWNWRMRCQEHISPTALLPEDLFPTVATLSTRWQAEEEAFQLYLESLSDDDLDKNISYNNTSGIPYQTPLWQILFHVINHSTQFRSEAAVQLTLDHHSPGDLDYIAFARTHPVRPD